MFRQPWYSVQWENGKYKRVHMRRKKWLDKDSIRDVVISEQGAIEHEL